jgi:hypothetical protein
MLNVMQCQTLNLDIRPSKFHLLANDDTLDHLLYVNGCINLDFLRYLSLSDLPLQSPE